MHLGMDADEQAATVTGTEAAGQKSSFSKAPRPASKWPAGSALEMQRGNQALSCCGGPVATGTQLGN